MSKKGYIDMTHEEFERAVMNKFLEGDGVFLELRKQYEHATVVSREITGCGFYTDFKVPDNLKVNEAHGTIHDVCAKFKRDDRGQSEIYLFRLYLENGVIETLEGYATLSDWKQNYDETTIDYLDDARSYELHDIY